MSNRKVRLTVIVPVAKRQELLEKCFFFNVPTLAIASIIICWITLQLPINDWPISLIQCRLLKFFHLPSLIQFLLLYLGISYFFPLSICFFSSFSMNYWLYFCGSVKRFTNTMLVKYLCMCTCSFLSFSYDNNDDY